MQRQSVAIPRLWRYTPTAQYFVTTTMVVGIEDFFPVLLSTVWDENSLSPSLVMLFLHYLVDGILQPFYPRIWLESLFWVVYFGAVTCSFAYTLVPFYITVSR